MPRRFHKASKKQQVQRQPENSVEGQKEAQEEEVIRLPIPKPDVVSVDKIEARPAAEELLMDDDLNELVESLSLERSWENDEGKTQGRAVAIGWFILIAICLLSLTGWGIFKLLTTEEKAPVTRDSPETILENRDEFHHQLSVVIEQYLAASGFDELRGLIRDEHRVAPLLKKSLSKRPRQVRKLKSLISITPFTICHHPFFSISVLLDDGHTDFILVEEGSGSFLVDWEADVAYQEIEIEEYLEARPMEPVQFRALIRLSRYYAYGYREEEYLSYRLGFPDSDEYLMAYSKRGTDLSRKIYKSFDCQYNTEHQFILKVRFPEVRSTSRIVLIEELVSPLWVFAEE